MSSWRSGVAPEVLGDVDALVVDALQAAERLLDSQGGFLPFGVVIDRDGETRYLAADPDQGEHPDTDAVIATLLDGIRATSGELRAIALVMDVLMDGSDAVRVELEHRERVVLRILMPYRLRRVSGGVERGELIAEPGQPMIWLGQPDDTSEFGPSGSGSDG